MCPKIEDIRMQHIVDYTKNYSTFATARENSSNHLKIFLVNEAGNVYIRNGRQGSWLQIIGGAADKIRSCIDHARGYVPVYKVNAVYGN